MDFKFERFLHVDSSLSAEQQEKVRQMLLKVTRGAEQQLLGDKRGEFAEGFFNLIHPDRRQTLAEEISALHSTKDESRFRAQIALLLCEAFYSGILFERGPEKEEFVLATHNLGRCSEYLGKAVRHLAVNSGTPQDKLRSMVANTSFGSIHENDFPTGPLKNDFQAIMEKLSTASQPQVLVNIAAMSNEEARSLIEQICRLSDDIWSGLGKT
jgi:hypothetical protein